jgi:hypothetical protein
MRKDRWVDDKNLDKWFSDKMDALDELAGPGSSIDALSNFMPEEAFMAICTEGLKAIDIIDSVNGGILFGQDAERMEAKIFYFYHAGINYYFLAKNKTELKKIIANSLAEYEKGCEPLEPEPPSKEERLKKLLEDIRNSHIGDSKGQTEQEAGWCAEIDELMEVI